MLRSLPASLLVVLLLAGCGGGGGGGGGASGTGIASSPVTLTFPNGRISAVGAYVTGTTTRTGHWTMYFDDPSGQKQWEGDYSNGAIDGGKPWREWNLDSSIRFDWTD